MNPSAGWHPDPHDPTQLRWWDGQQWTSATHPGTGIDAEPTAQFSEPTAPPPSPEEKKKTLLIGVATVIGLALVLGLITIFGDDSDDITSASSAQTSSAPTVAPTTTTSSRPAVIPSATLTPRTTTSQTTVDRSIPEPALSATEAGCEEPDASIVQAIEASLNPGLTLEYTAAVSTRVDGIEYTYTSGDVYENGSRHASSVVWITPGFGVMGLSGNSRRVSSLPFVRGIVDANAGDEYGQKVQDCVVALSRGDR